YKHYWLILSLARLCFLNIRPESLRFWFNSSTVLVGKMTINLGDETHILDLPKTRNLSKTQGNRTAL
ncbi:hypothetical protein ACEYW6_35010, partial [Nostoc sp. UIC 10607]|uniref:hypothetical protein n=1 Tax=Nostoc sp. UIC 10607 TaxID=3045935 RepID=UPI0039A35B09